MKKVMKWILILGGLFTLLLVAAIILIPMFVDVQSYKPEIEKQVTEKTGRPFTLGGDLDLSLFPWVGVSFSDLALGNPEGFDTKNFVKIKSFEARVKLMPLLSKKIEVKQFVLDGPEIYLTRRADGVANWEGLGQTSEDGGAPKKTAPVPEKKEEKPAPTSSGEIPIESLNVGEFAITNGRVIYKDQVASMEKEVTDLNFRLTNITLESPVGIAFDAMVDKQPVSLKGSIGPIGKEPGRGTINIDLGIEALNQLVTKVKGSVTDPVAKLNFDVDLEVAPFSPKKLLTTLGQEFPVKTKDSKVLEKVGVSLKAKGNVEEISVSDGLFILDDSRLKFLAAVKEMDRPDISFKLDLDKINLDRYLPPPAEKKEAETAGAGKPTGGGRGGAAPAAKEPIDYGPLRKLVIDGEILVGELIASGAKISNFEMKVTGKDGLFNLDPMKLNLYQGSVSTVGSLNVQGDSPITKVEVNTKGLQVGPLLRDTVQKDVLEGGVEAAVSISLEGDDPEKIKKTLNGKGDLKFIDGALVGIDIAGMVRDLKSTLAGAEKAAVKPRTDFAELHVPFTLTNGLFNTKKTTLSSPLLRLTATGDANLVTEALNMKVKPKLVGTIKGQGDKEARSGIAVPLIIGGTFQKPEFSADTEAMVGDLVPNKEELLETLVNPEAGKEGSSAGVKQKKKELKETGKNLEKQGKDLLKGFGFGK